GLVAVVAFTSECPVERRAARHHCDRGTCAGAARGDLPSGATGIQARPSRGASERLIKGEILPPSTLGAASQRRTDSQSNASRAFSQSDRKATFGSARTARAAGIALASTAAASIVRPTTTYVAGS